MYIRTLHHYNYLKDATFTLAELIANINKTSSKAVFEEFDVRDTEKCFILGPKDGMNKTEPSKVIHASKLKRFR